jgi:cytochrome c oxidase cbb3-type subunit 4
MFKFIKQYAETIQDIKIYPIISLFIFVLFFIAVLWYVKKMDNRNVDVLKHLPLADDNSFEKPSNNPEL